MRENLNFRGGKISYDMNILICEGYQCQKGDEGAVVKIKGKYTKQ